MRGRAIAAFINLACVLIASFLYIFTFTHRTLAKALYSYGSYYLIFLLVALWVITILQCILHQKVNLRSAIRSYGSGIAVSLVLASIIFVSVKPLFRVLSDETNLLAVSKSMVYEKRADNVTMGMWYYDNFYPMNREVEKRPLLFPFLVSIVHTLLGYRAENAFILNFLILVSLFLLIYLLIKNNLGDIWAFPAVLLVASQPIVSQCATSGGFDLLAALFLVICFACLKWFLEKPLSPLRFQLLWVSLLMLSNIRHEGILSFAIVMAFLAFFRHVKIKFFDKGTSVVYFSTPIILLLIYWQRLLIKDPFETKGAPFAIDYFIRNNITFLKTLVDYRFFLPYAAIINVLGVISLFYFGYLLFSERAFKEMSQRLLLAISAACLLANWALYTSYYNGLIDHPSDARYYVVFFILLSALALALFNNFRFFKQKPAYLMFFSIAMFMLYHPVSVEDRFSRTQTLPREYRFVMDFLKRESRQDRSFLVIADRPGQYAVHNYGAVNFQHANASPSVLEGFNNYLYRNIFVVQEIEFKTSKPTHNTSLKEDYALETLAESQNDVEHWTRISRVLPQNKKSK